MGKVCARCMKFGEWKLYGGVGVYKGRALCMGCRKTLKKQKARRNSSRDRQRYLDKVESR